MQPLRSLRVILILLVSFIPLHVRAQDSDNSVYKMIGVALMQPEELINQRTNADELGGYINSINKILGDRLNNYTQPTPSSGSIFIAVRPGNFSNAWIGFSPPIPSDLAETIRGTVRAITPPTTHGGIVVFALNVSLWGAPPITSNTAGLGPMPPEWVAAGQQNATEDVGKIADLAWRHK